MPSGTTLAIAGGGFLVMIIVILTIIYFVTSGKTPSPTSGGTGTGGTTTGGTTSGGTGTGGTTSGGTGTGGTTSGGMTSISTPTLGSLDDSAPGTGTGGPPPPVDCRVSGWGLWSACSKKCGGGITTRTKTIISQPEHGGRACPAPEELIENDTCNTQECPVDCEVSGWSEYSACSLPCGGGTQTKTRTVTKQPTFNGAACPPLEETQTCNTQGCPVDCVGSWAGCSVTCGEGIDTYRITTPAANGGRACPESDGTTRKCVQPPCGVDCVGDWVKNTTTDQDGWGQCSATCGSGTQTRTYKVKTEQVGSGKTCPYKDGQTETKQCPGLSPCPTPVDCIGDFSEWTGCSAGCGGGTRTRTYTIKTAAANGGKACPFVTGYKESEACNEASCCSSATIEDWYDVGSVICSGTASASPYIYQSRAVTFPLNPNGTATSGACKIPIVRTRNTAIGCPAVAPSNGTCSDPAVGWTAEKGCSLDTPVDAETGTCNPRAVPWSKTNGCTLPSGDVTPTPGTCSITGITWNSTDGCKISPATRTGSVSCDVGTWNESLKKCIVSPTTALPDNNGGTCPAGYTYQGGSAIGSKACAKTVSCNASRINIDNSCPACNC